MCDSTDSHEKLSRAAYLWNDHSTCHLPSYLQMSMDPMAGEKLSVDSEEDNAINPGALAG